jgi:hypothetical protein
VECVAKLSCTRAEFYIISGGNLPVLRFWWFLIFDFHKSLVAAVDCSDTSGNL